MNNEEYILEFTNQFLSSPILIAVQWYAGIGSIVFMILLINRHKMNILDSFKALYFLKEIDNGNSFAKILRASIWVVSLLGLVYFLYVVYEFTNAN